MPENRERRVALIMGASSGIGAATARAMARDGFRLILAARGGERLNQIGQELKEMVPEDSPVTVQADVGLLEGIKACVMAGLERFGKLDVLFANAGSARLGWLEELQPEEDIADQLRTNLEGVILAAREVLPHMQSRRQGHIILMSSLAGWIATPTYSVYAASKFGVRGFGRALRGEVAPWGIQVSTVFVGAVRTGFAAEAVRRRRTGWTTPPALVLTPERVAASIIRLTHHPRATVVLPRSLWAVIWLDFLWPGLLDRLAVREFVRRERQEELAGRPPLEPPT